MAKKLKSFSEQEIISLNQIAAELIKLTEELTVFNDENEVIGFICPSAFNSAMAIRVIREMLANGEVSDLDRTHLNCCDIMSESSLDLWEKISMGRMPGDADIRPVMRSYIRSALHIIDACTQS